MRIDRAKRGSRKKIVLLAAVAACALMSLSVNAETDIYGNEIKEVDGKTYKFWVSGTKAEVAALSSSSHYSSTSRSLCSGTFSTPSAEPIALEARFRTWFESLGTALRSDKFKGFILRIF